MCLSHALRPASCSRVCVVCSVHATDRNAVARSLAQLVERTKAAIDKELELLHREFKKLREIKLRPANV